MTAPKKKGKTGRASVTNSPALHSTAFPPLDDDEEQAYLLKMEENDNDGDYTAGGAGKPKKPAPGSKKPVSSSSTTGAAGKQQAPVSGGASKAGAGAKEKGKETKRSGSMKIEDSEEALFTAEKRGARGRAGSSKKVVEEVEEKEEELVEEDPEEEDDGVTRCVCDEDNDDLSSGLMIECDTCKCWQHGPCVGLWNEKDCPDRYFCELCRPSWHGPGGILRKAHRKNAGPPPPAGHRRSPSVTSTSHAPSQARNKPRESADAALVSAFLAGEQHVPATERERDSQSPSPPPARSKKDEPVAKKRSTMNSRDAAYDDAIALSILGPGSAAMRARLAKSSRGGDGSNASGSGAEDEEEEEDRPNKSRRSRSGDSPAVDDENGSKRRRISMDGDAEDHMDVEEPEETLEDARREYEANEARRQAEAEAEAAERAEREPSLPPPPLPTVPARAKHPNQYTYRPKNGAGSSSRTVRASPVKRTTKDSASSKGDSAYSGGGGSTSGGAAFLGGVVENLIRSQRPRDWTPQEGGWGMPDHLKHLSHLLPTPTPTPLVVPAPTTYSISAQGVEQLYEQPTKVRFPNKRMTMPEMKKRARNVLEYLGRVEVEMSERAERRALLKKAGEVQERERRREAGEDVGDEVVESSGEGEKREQSETVKAMDALTRELHEFQRKFWGEVE